MGDAWPRDKDARTVIRTLCDQYGWSYDTAVGKSSHGIGFLRCGDGCRHAIYSTPKANQARTIWGLARKCLHGHRPEAHKWSR